MGPMTQQVESQYRLKTLTFRELADVLPLRSEAYGDPVLMRPEVPDLLGRHYALLDKAHQLVAAVRIGPERFEQHLSDIPLPEWMSSNYLNCLVISSRFFTTPAFSSKGLTIAKAFFDAIWKIELGEGTRLTACVVRSDLISFYLRLGFFYVVGSGHLDLRDRPSCLMTCPANEIYNSPFQETFAGIEQPCNLDNLLTAKKLLMNFRQVKQQLDLETTNGKRS